MTVACSRGKFSQGASASISMASGRAYCHSVVGTNFSPNRDPSLSSSAAIRVGSNAEYTCFSSGSRKGSPKRARFTPA